MTEQIRFTFCSSLTPGPFRVSVTESKGWERHSGPRGSGIPKFVQGGRFVLRLSTRYAVDVPQCRRVAYRWRPKRVMLMPGARAVDITIAYPVSLRRGSPIILTDHEVAIR